MDLTQASIFLEGASKHQNAENKGVAAGYGGDCLFGPYLVYVSHIPPPIMAA